MGNLTKEDFETITNILYKKNPHLTGAEWILICFTRDELYEVITSLWDASGIVQLRAVLRKMFDNPKWFN
jgi:hypothetical protein